MTAKRKPDVAALIEQRSNALEAGKASYILADKIAAQIAREVGASKRGVTMLPGVGFKVVNNRRMLKEKGVLFGHGAVRLYDIEPMTRAELAAYETEKAEAVGA